MFTLLFPVVLATLAAAGVEIHPTKFTSMCLDVKDGNIAPGSQVQIRDCSSTRSQNWVIPRGVGRIRLASRADLCLDAGTSPRSSYKTTIQNCGEANHAQIWRLQANGHITLINTGQCLDLTNGNGRQGTQIQTWTCISNGQNQIWKTTRHRFCALDMDGQSGEMTASESAMPESQVIDEDTFRVQEDKSSFALE